MKKDIIINIGIGESRVAILEDGHLAELYLEKPENERMVGDIYYGKVAKVIKGMQAAFVNIGLNQDAFLHFSDVSDNLTAFNQLFPQEEARNRGGQTSQRQRHRSRDFNEPQLRQGQPILVQVTKEPISSKGARVTTEISLPGRFLVLIPYNDMIGVSRKITNRRERARLKQIGRAIKPEGFGLVIRTVSENRDEAALRADLEDLVRMWETLTDKVRKNTPPLLVHKDMDVLSSVIRDLFTNDVSLLAVDNKKMHKQIVKYVRDVAPALVDRTELYTGRVPIFDKYGIETEITRSLSRKVWLKSGGYIFFDHTEALAAIDVNSGRFIGKKDHDANSLRINLEAAREIARQLRLRDIGGIIIIDFIDMVEEKNRKRLQEEFLRELELDRAQVNVAPISQFGIIEMTRERIRPALLFTLSDPCPACLGTGRVLSKTTTMARIERWLMRYRAEKGDRSLQLVVNPELAAYLSSGYRSQILRLSWKYWTRIKLIGDENVAMDEFRFLSKDGQEDLTNKYFS
ncbi:MAG TPA: Rne/Rng family ribonuclease [bacterium]|nr:Rne/Rng family ribonuclease [bacterium]HQG45675.1 Rne/Rng family ribonuclease [bacterium]HQI47230.1 Rne/Rng family ribonuclease [bacterium]HQJ65144.1 Rne/Rng family ribonuclease [bacterium]